MMNRHTLELRAHATGRALKKAGGILILALILGSLCAFVMADIGADVYYNIQTFGWPW